MNREEKIQKMVANYIQKRNRSNESSTMEFHRKHLLLFLNRFCQFLARFETPSSSLLSHDIFLIVEAATIVAKSDWAKAGKADTGRCGLFSRYFDAFDDLASGLEPLDRGAALCVEALTLSNDS
jgi:hypothetical protein